MKTPLLFLGLLWLASGSLAQAQFQLAPRWVEVNPQATSNTSPDYLINRIHTVSPNVMWATLYDANAPNGPVVNSFVRTYNAAGRDFDWLDISSTRNPSWETNNIHGITNLVAVASVVGRNGGGELLRTTNGGFTWTNVTTPSQFAAPDGFVNFVHMFDANVGVAVGDPNGGTYEILRTTDGGFTWNRVPAPAPLMNGEYGEVNAYYASGNTIWAAVGAASPVGFSNSRILRSTDAGLTWTAVNLPMAGPATTIAFRDALNGLCFNKTVANGMVVGYQVARSTDGGTTWARIVPSLADTSSRSPRSGKFYYTGLDATQNTFISYGRWRVLGQGPNRLPQFGYSTSTDGIYWRDIQTSMPINTMDVLNTSDFATTGQGYAGFFTNYSNGDGGIFKTTGIRGALGGPIESTRNAALQQALSVYPNPSNGSFTLKLNTGVKSGTQVIVLDAVGRAVYNRKLNATTAQTASVDLGQATPGVYTLEVRTPEGTAQQKLIIRP